MFTGLIEEKGKIVSVSGGSSKKQIKIETARVASCLRPGDSVAVDGVCQTVTAVSGSSFLVDAMEATMQKTTFALFRPGREVNLEKSLTPSSPLGGHLVQGHVSGKGVIEEVSDKNRNTYLVIKAGTEITDFCIPEGSIALDGVSLTISHLERGLVTVNIIPETLERTTLGSKKKGDLLNIETDMIGRYIVAFLSRHIQGKSGGVPESKKGRNSKIGSVTAAALEKWGF